MGQQEVMDFLTKFKSTWFTSDELSVLLKTSQGAVGRSLLKLRQGVMKHKVEKQIQ